MSFSRYLDTRATVRHVNIFSGFATAADDILVQVMVVSLRRNMTSETNTFRMRHLRRLKCFSRYISPPYWNSRSGEPLSNATHVLDPLHSILMLCSARRRVCCHSHSWPEATNACFLFLLVTKPSKRLEPPVSHSPGLEPCSTRVVSVRPPFCGKSTRNYSSRLFRPSSTLAFHLSSLATVPTVASESLV
jgi:hypothetical protein